MPNVPANIPGQHSKVISGPGAATLPHCPAPPTCLQPAAVALAAPPGRRITVHSHPVTKRLLI